MSGLGTEPTAYAGRPEFMKGPVFDIFCCHSCHNTSCRCDEDCAQPLFQQGELLALPSTKETYEGYPALGDEYAVCEIWSFGGRVKAVWWAPMY